LCVGRVGGAAALLGHLLALGSIGLFQGLEKIGLLFPKVWKKYPPSFSIPLLRDKSLENDAVKWKGNYQCSP
jgi:hypothetical protein